MPTPLKLPFPPLIQLDQDAELKGEDLTRRLGMRLGAGVSVCVRSMNGPVKRGGYFFHLRRDESGHFLFATFDGHEILLLEDASQAAAFINHVSGRRYSEEMWEIAQRINLRKDREDEATDSE